MQHLLYALAYALERAPWARYHVLHADLYYIAEYGHGRYPGGAWFRRFAPRWRLPWSHPEATTIWLGRGHPDRKY